MLTRRTLHVGVALAALGCNLGGDCALVGCTDSLRVVIDPPVQSFRYDVTLRLDGVASEFACATTTATGWRATGAPLQLIECNEREMRLTASPQRMEVSLRATRPDGTPGDARALDVRPGYRISQPNGPDCEPVCRVADVTLR